MTFPVSRHAAIASLALAIASGAWSQSAPDTALNSVQVTATRTSQPVSDTLSDTLTISSDQIADAGAGSLVDLLQRQRGVEVSRTGGPGSAASVFLRGANTQQNVVLVDGVRIGSSTLGGANWSAIALSSIDHVEIVLGPLSSLYGADAIGGVVQIFTKQGEGAPLVTAFAGVGSDRIREAEASIAGATGGAHSVRYAISAGKEKSDGFSATKPDNYAYNADNDGYDKDNLAGQLSLSLAQGHEVGLSFMHSKLDAQYDSGDAAFDARNLQQLDHLRVYAKNQFLPDWSSQVQLSQARDKAGSSEADAVSQIDTRQTGICWQNDIRIGSDMLQLLAEHRKEAVTSTDAALARSRSTRSFAAAYNLKRGAHLASASVRNDDSAQYGSKTTGALGYGYRLTSALRASASVGTSFRAPSFNDLYYPGYGVASNQPEKGRNVEAGLYFNDGATQLSAAYYHNRLTDLLVSTAVCPVLQEDHPYGCAYNVDKALLEGLSLSARRQFTALGLTATLDLQDPHDETTGKQLVRRAKQHANFSADYNQGRLDGGIEFQVSGQRYDDLANRTTLGGYGLVNLFASYQVARDWSLLARWNNLADKQYELARNYATAGSSMFIGLRYGTR